jgi:hypothetical protein
MTPMVATRADIETRANMTRKRCHFELKREGPVEPGGTEEGKTFHGGRSRLD